MTDRPPAERVDLEAEVERLKGAAELWRRIQVECGVSYPPQLPGLYVSNEARISNLATEISALRSQLNEAETRLNRALKSEAAAHSTKAHAEQKRNEAEAQLAQERDALNAAGARFLASLNEARAATVDANIAVAGLLEELATTREALGGCVEWMAHALDDGMTTLHDHDDGCSEDADCDCSLRPEADRFNAVYARAIRARGAK